MKKKLIIVILLIIFALITGVLLLSRRGEKRDEVKTAPAGTVNLAPPTEQDKKDADDNKQAIIDREKKLSEQKPSNITTPIITYAGQYDDGIEVGGYANVFEDGGVCKVTITQGSRNISKQVSSVKNVNSTDCPTVTFPKSELGFSGQATVVLDYSSALHSGSSVKKDISIK